MSRSSLFPTRRGALAVLLACVLGTPCASGAEPERSGRVALLVRDCPEAFESSLRSILALELGELLEQTAPSEPPRSDALEITCEAATARIAARSARDGQVVHNDLRLDAFPGDAAPRAAVLAGLEALRAIDPTLAERIEEQRAQTRASAAPPRQPPPPPVRPAPAPAAVPARKPPRALTRVLAGASARFFLGDPATTALGARLELSRRFRAPWDAGVDVDATFARREVDLGAVEAKLFSTAVWLGARAGGARMSGTAALGGRLGLALLRGDPAERAEGHSVARPFAGPLVALRADAAAGPVALALVGEGGIAAAGAEGLSGGTAEIGVTGAWLALSANAGIHF